MAEATVTPGPPGSRGPRLRGRLRSLSASLRQAPRALVLILVFAALESVAWDAAVPAFQGPDEAAHFAYVQHLAETGSIPNPNQGSAPYSTEESDVLNWLNLSSLIGDLGARPAWTSADLAALHRIERSMPRGSRANGSGLNPQAKNPPLYYALLAIPYRVFVWLPLLKRLFVLRLFSSVFRLLTIVFTWLLAGELFRRSRWKQSFAASIVALQPKLAFMSGVISVDNLLAAVVAGFLLMAVRLVQRGPSMGRVLGASAFAAAAVLTQGRGLVTLPVLLVALAVAWARHRPAAREMAPRILAAAGAIAGALALYVLLAGLSNGTSAYGGQVTQLNSAAFNVGQFLSFIYQFYFPALPGMAPRIGPAYGYQQVFIQSFYGTFGSLEVLFSNRIDAWLQVLSAVGLVGFYTACVVRWRRLRAGWPAVAVMFTLLLTSIVFLHYVSYQALLGNGGSDPLITGRYLLPLVPLFALAITFTIGSLPRRAALPIAALVLAIGVVLSLDAIGITAARFYA
ncbi:MAG: hypothetical protein ABSC56_12225 [Solirubrobacteraceae bacterium]|jgi:hypothetical protein